MTLPNFVIVGALKAGTSSLFHYLTEHPQVYGCPLGEPRFFAYDAEDPEHVASSRRRFPVQTLEEYEQLFAGVQDEVAIGEKSPVYFGSIVAMDNIKKVLPDVKLILCLRQPVDRLYSLYLMNFKGGYDTRDVYEVCRPSGKTATDNKYCPRVELWLKRYRRDQISVMVLEQLKSDPTAQVKVQYEFLGVDTSFKPNLTKQHNVGGVPKNKLARNVHRTLSTIRAQRSLRKLKTYLPGAVTSAYTSLQRSTLAKPDPMPDDLAEELKSFYRDDVIALEQLLDIDLSVWNFH